MIKISDLDFQYIAKLTVSAQKGSSDAFAELYAATYQRCYTYAYRYLKDEFLAQDALQETYIAALRNLAELKDPKLFVSWLDRICFHTCFDIHHKNSRYNTELSEFSNELLEQQTTQETNPEVQIVTIDQKEYMLRQILNLPFSESQAILFKYYHNMKLDEIAALLGISRSSVKRYLKSGLARLKKLLKA